MDILRNLFGNVTSGIIRLLVTVGILAATYFFIVKPVLDTTENVSDTVNSSIQSANESFKQSFGPNSETEKALVAPTSRSRSRSRAPTTRRRPTAGRPDEDAALHPGRCRGREQDAALRGQVLALTGRATSGSRQPGMARAAAELAAAVDIREALAGGRAYGLRRRYAASSVA